MTLPRSLQSRFDYAALVASTEEDPASNASVYAETYWEIEQSHPRTGKRVFTVYLHLNGVLENHHPNDKTPADDRWKADEDGLTLYFNNSYAVYSARQADEHLVSRTAKNREGDVWGWSAAEFGGKK